MDRRVHVLGSSGAAKFGQGGEGRRAGKNMIACLPGFDLTGPANEKRMREASSLVEVAFPSAKLDLCLGVDVGSEKTGRF